MRTEAIYSLQSKVYTRSFSWKTSALTSILCLGTTSFPTYASSTTPECGVLAPPSLSFVQHCSIKASSRTIAER